MRSAAHPHVDGATRRASLSRRVLGTRLITSSTLSLNRTRARSLQTSPTVAAGLAAAPAESRIHGAEATGTGTCPHSRQPPATPACLARPLPLGYLPPRGRGGVHRGHRSGGEAARRWGFGPTLGRGANGNA